MTSKLVLTAIMGLAMGLAAAFMPMRLHLKTREAAWRHERSAAEDETRRLRVMLEARDAEIHRLTDQAKTLQSERTATAAPLTPPSSAEAEDADDLAMLPAAPSDKRNAETAPSTPERAAKTPASLPSRNELATRLREGLQNYLEAEISKSADPAAAQRLTALSEGMVQQVDLVQQLQEAKTDAEKDVLRQDLSDLRASMRGMVEEQQVSMLRQLATQYGVSAPDKQEQFIQSLREVQSSPFFRMGAGFVNSVSRQ